MFNFNFENLDLKDRPEPTLEELTDNLNLALLEYLLACEQYQSMPTKRRQKALVALGKESSNELRLVIDHILHGLTDASPDEIIDIITTIVESDNSARIDHFNQITESYVFENAGFRENGFKADVFKMMFDAGDDPQIVIADLIMKDYDEDADEDFRMFLSIVAESEPFKKLQQIRGLGAKGLQLGIVSASAAAGAYVAVRKTLK